MASNPNSHRVLAADSSGQVLEEVALPEANARQALWEGGGRDMPLPALPPQPRPAAPQPVLGVRAADAGEVALAIFDAS